MIRPAHQLDEVSAVLESLPDSTDRAWGVLPRRDQEFVEAMRAQMAWLIEPRELVRLRSIRSWLGGR